MNKKSSIADTSLLIEDGKYRHIATEHQTANDFFCFLEIVTNEQTYTSLLPPPAFRRPITIRAVHAGKEVNWLRALEQFNMRQIGLRSLDRKYVRAKEPQDSQRCARMYHFRRLSKSVGKPPAS